jgi:Zn-dependent peptidase ImmA (M78 family)/DNA-binding XRE family transcriptional regulator
MASPEQEALQHINWPSLGARLQSARKTSGKTQDEAAAHLGVSRTTLVAIEQGKRRLSPAELYKLAQFYQQDLNYFLREHKGSEEVNLEVVFRARFEPRLLEAVGQTAVDQAVGTLRQYAENYLDLEEMLGSPLPKRYPALYSYEGMTAEVAADEIAQQERTRLGLGDSPILGLREFLETEVGLRIFYLDLPAQIAGMFGFTEQLGGCMAINIHHPPDRQRMTLAHEYAHFLTNRSTPEIQILRAYDRKPETERFADAFAFKFLLPESGVHRLLRSHLKSSKTFTLGDMLRFARYYGVSFEAFSLRLEDLELIPRGSTEAQKQAGLKVRTAQEAVGLEAEKSDHRIFPERYRVLAVRAFLDEELSEGQLMQYLGNVSRLEARRIVAALSQEYNLDEEGQQFTTTLDVEEPIPLRSR